MSGGSRGIGLAIALRAARDGANIALLAKTDTPHPKLEGTVHSAAEQIRAAGGNALPIVGDVRNDDDITEAVLKTQGEFGGIDIVVNNASVIDLSRSLDLAAEEVRPHAGRQRARHVHALAGGGADPAARPRTRTSCRCRRRSTSTPKWLGAHTGYTLAKYGMTMATLGLRRRVREGRASPPTRCGRARRSRPPRCSSLLGGDTDDGGEPHARDLRGRRVRGAHASPRASTPGRRSSSRTC